MGEAITGISEIPLGMVWIRMLGFGMCLKEGPHQVVGRDLGCRLVAVLPARLASGPGVQAADDDNACGTVECGGWYGIQGNAGVLSTETCHGHVDITTDRCEGVDDCKDDDTDDCDSQPLEAAIQESCGVCKYMTGCSGTSPGVCANYPEDTPTSGTCGDGRGTINLHTTNGDITVTGL